MIFERRKQKNQKKRKTFSETLIEKNKKDLKELVIIVRNGPIPFNPFMLLNRLNKSFDTSKGMN